MVYLNKALLDDVDEMKILNKEIAVSNTTYEKFILKADPEMKFKLISGKAFDYKLVKLQLKLAGTVIDRVKTIWVFTALDTSIQDLKANLAGRWIYFIRAKGIMKTKIEIYMILADQIKSVRILKSKQLSFDQAYALNYYFSKRNNDVRKHDFFECSKDEIVDAQYIANYLNLTNNEYMKGELLRWVMPVQENLKEEKC